MKRLYFLAAACLTLAASQVGHPRRATPGEDQTATTTGGRSPETNLPASEPQNPRAPAKLIMVFGPPPPHPIVRIPPPEEWEPAPCSDDELAQAQWEITELMRRRSATAPAVKP